MKKILIIIILTFTVMNLYSKTDIYSKIKTQFSNAKSISVEFRNSETNIKGEMIADKYGRYMIKTPNRTICTDKKSIWNYSKEENKLIISNYEVNDEISIDNVFFKFIDNYKLKSEKKVSASTVLLLQAQNKTSSLAEVELWVKEINTTISKIVFINNYGNDSWEILKLKKNQKLSKDAFDFKIPKETNVIDLR